MKNGFRIKIASLRIFLVRSQEEVDNNKILRGYIVPDMTQCTAKACYVHHTTSNEHAIIIIYPNLLTDEPIDVTCTLVHEACHAWDFIKEHFGYGNDTELHAYSVESIFEQLYNVYAKLHHKESKCLKN